MTDKPTAEQIARKLGRAQRKVILALSLQWGRAPNNAAAKRLWYRPERLIDHKHQTDNCWCLTHLGLAVQSAIRAGDHLK